MTHSLHRGYNGRHTFCPHVTIYRLMYGHQRASVALYSACSVSSGVRVDTHPSLFAMRCTCVSTQMFFRLLNDRINTRFAVLRPTPGSVSNSSMVPGTRPPKRSTSMRHVSLTCRAL